MEDGRPSPGTTTDFEEKRQLNMPCRVWNVWGIYQIEKYDTKQGQINLACVTPKRILRRISKSRGANKGRSSHMQIGRKNGGGVRSIRR